jgi:hypothetical protein
MLKCYSLSEQRTSPVTGEQLIMKFIELRSCGLAWSVFSSLDDEPKSNKMPQDQGARLVQTKLKILPKHWISRDHTIILPYHWISGTILLRILMILSIYMKVILTLRTEKPKPA